MSVKQVVTALCELLQISQPDKIELETPPHSPSPVPEYRNNIKSEEVKSDPNRNGSLLSDDQMMHSATKECVSCSCKISGTPYFNEQIYNLQHSTLTEKVTIFLVFFNCENSVPKKANLEIVFPY